MTCLFNTFAFIYMPCCNYATIILKKDMKRYEKIILKKDMKKFLPFSPQLVEDTIPSKYCFTTQKNPGLALVLFK